MPGPPGNEFDVTGRETAASQSLPLGYKGPRGLPGPRGYDSWPICVGEGCPSGGGGTRPFSCATCDPSVHACDTLCPDSSTCDPAVDDCDEVVINPPEWGEPPEAEICRNLHGSGALTTSPTHTTYGTASTCELCQATQGRGSRQRDLGGTEAECTAAGGTVAATTKGCAVCRFGATSVPANAVYAARMLVWTHGSGPHCDQRFSSSDRSVGSPPVGSCGPARGGGTWQGAPAHAACPSGWEQLEHWSATAATFVDARPGGSDGDAFCIAGHGFSNQAIETGIEHDHSERLFSSDIYRCCLGQTYRYQVGCLKVGG